MQIRPSHVIGLVLVIVTIPQLFQKRWQWLDLPWLLLILFLVFGVVSAVINYSGLQSYGRLVLYSYEFILAFVVMRNTSTEDLPLYRTIIFVSGSLVALFVIWQFVGDALGFSQSITLLALRYSKLVFGYPRVTGLSFEPATLANYMVIPFSLTFVSWLLENRQRYFMLSIGFLTVMLLTFSRSVFIGLIIIFLVVGICLLIQKNYKKLLLFISMALIAAGCCATALFVGVHIAKPVNEQAPSYIQTTVPQTGISQQVVSENLTRQLISIKNNTSVQTRIDSWREGTRLFIAHPLFGLGPANLQSELGKIFGVDTVLYSGNSLSRNVYVQILAEHGLVGSLMLLIFGAIILWLALRAWPKLKYPIQNIWALSIGLMSTVFFTQWQSLGNLAVTHAWILIGILLSIIGGIELASMQRLRSWVQNNIWLKQNKWALLISIGAFTYYLLYSLLLYRKFQFPMLDLGMFNRHMYGLLHYGLDVNPLKGYNLLGDHAHFFLLPLVPLYFFWQNPTFLLFIEALYIVLSGWPIYLIAKKYSPNTSAAAFWLLPYFVFFGFWSALAYPFHDSAVVVLPLAWALYFLLVSKNYRYLCITLVLLMLFREDMPLVALMVGIYLIVIEREYWLGAGISLAGTVYFFWVTKVWLPIHGPSNYGYEKTQFGNSIVDIAKATFTKPLQVLQSLVSPNQKLKSMIAMLLSFGGFSIFALEILILLLPLWLGRFLSTEAWRWGALEHYSASQAPILAAASIIGLYRLIQYLHQRFGYEKMQMFTLAIIITTALALGINIVQHQKAIIKPLALQFYQLTPAEQSGHTALQIVPSQASVGAQSGFSQLSSRKEIYNLPLPEGVLPEYIILSPKLEKWPFADSTAVLEYETKLETQGYQPIFVQNDVMVLKKVNEVIR
jgi:uncharacterized membrane protein